MRRAWLLLALAGCDPEFTANSYFCGEEMSCPPTLACDGVTATCVYERDVQHFVCPAGTNDNEPDDALADAYDLGAAGCGALAPSPEGCIDNATDVDHVAINVACESIDVRLRFGLAFAPLAVDLLDAAGTVVASGELCDAADASAQVTVCLTAAVAPGDYVVRVQMAEGAPDCDGLCDFNHYSLSLS